MPRYVEFPVARYYSVPWYGYFTSGKFSHSWKQFDNVNTILEFKDDGVVHVRAYENVGKGEIYAVHYLRHEIAPVVGGRHFWLEELDRYEWTGVL